MRSTPASPIRRPPEPAATPPGPHAARSAQPVGECMGRLEEIRVPDIGGQTGVPVIELMASVGDAVAVGQGLVTLESDKATIEVPSPVAGVLREWKVQVGDTLSEGQQVALVEVEAADAGAVPETAPPAPSPPAVVEPPPGTPAPAVVAAATSVPVPPHASPLARRIARERRVEIQRLRGTARGGRISREDVLAAVQGVPAAPHDAVATTQDGEGFAMLPWPEPDFSRFGQVATQSMGRVRRISAANLSRNWVRIPHVTQHEDADIGALEALRLQLNGERPEDGVRLTLLAFLIKACAGLLGRFPDFNASLDAGGETLVLKKYVHIGFATDTADGLVVPVVRDADRKGLLDIARETAALARQAREGGLAAADMQGGCFTISSLGGIGGNRFTPIINAPEVAILGVSRAAMRPVWDGQAFQPRLMLPLSLSYDHRVIDGAAAARFTTALAQVLADMRRLLL
ncbi:dihydrolipoyllysine-residue acetyltransferase [Stenotrophomonas sp. CPCC 101365]|uniref:Acetyltransferase component of pyruvate dehydrogenase complex n=2 Tax=Stenotrophomonas mori TaxID=2871096 RepID=A0ABT0SJ46_9GAMM|nr:dihydrolipoyllysine-residue acetyltransferase [Stenotrophomonas mori]MCL7715349.1 dihydrolipoyllysine-residue acetyltransferase [Stenotrophomonas mori]